MGAKRCSFSNSLEFEKAQSPIEQLSDDTREVFMKTLGFFCAVQEGGCLFSVGEDEIACSSSPSEESNQRPASGLYKILRDNRAGEKDPHQCSGKLLFCRDEYYSPFIKYILSLFMSPELQFLT